MDSTKSKDVRQNKQRQTQVRRQPKVAHAWPIHQAALHHEPAEQSLESRPEPSAIKNRGLCGRWIRPTIQKYKNGTTKIRPDGSP